jgi:hypothetical protein
MAREPTRNTNKSKNEAQAAKPTGADNQKQGAEQSGAELLKAQHQELQSTLAKRSDANADKSAIIKEFIVLWLPHQAVEEEIVVPALKDSGFDQAKIVASEIRKDLINILLADLLQDEDEESVEPRLEALAREFDALIEAHEADGESIRTSIQSAEGESPSLGSRLTTRYDRLKQRFADIDDNFEDAVDMLAPRRLSLPSGRQQSRRYSDTRDRRQQGRFEDDRGYSRGGRERDDQGRFLSEGASRSRSRFQGDDEHYGPRSLGSMGRDRDDEGRFASRGAPYEGRGQRGGYGEPEGRSEGARSGGQGRPREYDEDERYRSRGGGQGRQRSGWYGDPEGHSEASRRGWERSGHGESGWHGDPEGHSRAARRGSDEGREGEGPDGSRSRYEDDNRQGYQGRRGPSDYDDQRRPPRGGSRGERY